MLKNYFLGFFISSLLLGCGSTADPLALPPSVAIQSVPVIKRISPTSGRVGDTLTLFGFGFSTAPGDNIITVGGKATAAETYALVDPPTDGEIEQLTFKVPTGATTGASGVFVTVFELTSNADVQFTVNP